MLGSYRGIVLTALGGLAVLAAIGTASQFAAVRIDSPRAYPEYQETHEEAQNRLPLLLREEAAKRAVKQQPCRQPQGHDASDLCAQWRTADAGERASRWAWWQMILSGFAVIGLIITLWFNHEAWKQARDNQEDTEVALGHAEKSANAMASLAETFGQQLTVANAVAATNREIAENQQRVFKMQMRAYLSVAYGGAIFQQAPVLKFEARPLILNSGNTPAKSVRHYIKAAILPYPLPLDYQFEEAPPIGGGGFVPPNQDRSMSAAVDNLIHDDLVQSVKVRFQRALYTWGKVVYLDEFGDEHETHFGLCYMWLYHTAADFNIMAEYLPDMNHAT